MKKDQEQERWRLGLGALRALACALLIEVLGAAHSPYPGPVRTPRTRTQRTHRDDTFSVAMAFARRIRGCIWLLDIVYSYRRYLRIRICIGVSLKLSESSRSKRTEHSGQRQQAGVSRNSAN
jgi:hypothetical protein